MNIFSTRSEDSGCPLEPFLMISFNPVVVDHSFGIIKFGFRCIHKSRDNLQYSPRKCAYQQLACLLLIATTE